MSYIIIESEWIYNDPDYPTHESQLHIDYNKYKEYVKNKFCLLVSKKIEEGYVPTGGVTTIINSGNSKYKLIQTLYKQ